MNYSKKHIKLLCYRYFRDYINYKTYKGRKDLYTYIVAEIENAAQYGVFRKHKK